MASNMNIYVHGCVKIPVLAKQENAVGALVLGLLQLCGPSFDIPLKDSSVRQIVELMDVNGALSLRLLIVEYRPKPEVSPKKEQKPATTFEGIICRNKTEGAKLEKVAFTPMELWEASQRARQFRKERKAAGQTVQRKFRVVSAINIPKDLAIIPANAQQLQSLVASALDTAILKLAAQKTLRKPPKPLMYNRLTRVLRVGVEGGWTKSTWENFSEGSGWGGWGSEEDNEEAGGYKVQYKPTTWSEDTYFRQHKRLGRYRCYVHTLLRWNWIPHDEQSEARDDEEGEERERPMLEENFEEEEYFDMSSPDYWAQNELATISDEA